MCSVRKGGRQEGIEPIETESLRNIGRAPRHKMPPVVFRFLVGIDHSIEFESRSRSCHGMLAANSEVELECVLACMPITMMAAG